MYTYNSVRAALTVAFCLLGGVETARAALANCTLSPAFAQSLAQNFKNNGYQLCEIPMVVNIPGPFSGIAFTPNDLNTLLMAGHIQDTTAAIWTVGVTRDSQGHVIGIKNNAKLFAPAPGLGRSVAMGPGRMAFYTNVDAGLGIIGPDGKTPHPPIPLPGIGGGAALPLAFVPPGWKGGGALKLATFDGKFYSVGLARDAAGAFSITDVMGPSLLQGIAANNFPVGLGYVAAGNPLFPAEALLVATWDFNIAAGSQLLAYPTDDQGNPGAGVPTPVTSNLGVSGMTVDPLTGDLLFTSFWGSSGVFLLTGFTVPPTPVFKNLNFTVNEASGNAQITVKRGGSPHRPLSVRYSTGVGMMAGARYAVPNVNYTPTAGTLSWAAGDRNSKTFTVPILSDGVYNSPLRVDLKLSLVGSGMPLPSAALHIFNNDPKPTVTLASAVESTVSEAVGTVKIIATLNKPTPLPVTVPFTFSGTALANKDYGFDLDSANKPVRSITFPANTIQAALNLRVNDDLLNEPTETLIATLGTPTNAVVGPVTVNTWHIEDNDPQPMVAFSAAKQPVREGAKGAGVPVSALLVRLSAVSGWDVTVPITLTSGTPDNRIVMASLVTIPAGKLSTYAGTVADDALRQGTKTLGFTLGAPTHATLGTQQTTALIIGDND